MKTKNQLLIGLLIIVVSLTGLFYVGRVAEQFKVVAEVTLHVMYIFGLATFLSAASDWYHGREDKQ